MEGCGTRRCSWWGIFSAVLVFWCLTLNARAEDLCGGLADRVGHGGILWTDNAVVVQGTASPGVLRHKDKNVAEIKRMAKRAATLDAYRKAAALLSGVRVTSDSVAADSARVVSKINAFVRGAQICKEKYYADGGVDMVVAVPLSGAFAMDQLSQAGTKIADTPSDFSGLIVDARGLAFSPALAPRVISPDGTVLFSEKQVKKDIFLKRAAAFYLQDPKEAGPHIVGNRPLKTAALALGSGSPSDLVVSPKAADILSTAPDFLGDGKIAIIIHGARKLSCDHVTLEEKEHRIDWARKIVAARGVGKIDFDSKMESATRIRMMEQAAEINARKNLLKAFAQIRVDGRSHLLDLPAVSGRIKGVVRNAVRCGAKYYQDGSAELILAAPFEGIAAPHAGAENPAGLHHRMSKAAPSGLIVDASGLRFKPVLSPVLLTPAGTRAYHQEMVSKAYVAHSGVADYCASMAEAKSHPKAGDAPVTVRAVKVSSDAGQLFLTAQGAEEVNRLREKSDVLVKGRVVIVTQNTIEQ